MSERVEFLNKLLDKSCKINFTVDKSVFEDKSVADELDDVFNYLAYVDDGVTVFKIIKKNVVEFIVEIR